jgi:hypothetical protein
VLRYEDANPGEYWGYGNNTGFHVITNKEVIDQDEEVMRSK